jgi:hypothetical protein
LKLIHEIRIGSGRLIRVPSSLPEHLAPFVLADLPEKEASHSLLKNTIRQILIDKINA